MMKTKLIITLFLCLPLISCNKQTIFSEQKDLSQKGWDKNTAIGFDIDINDTISSYDILVTLRNNETYPNQNLWLFIEEIKPDSVIKKDTVQCFLVDNQGYWIGTGIGSLHYISVFYKQNIQFKQKGTYHYNIKHGMRYDLLEGLNDIGIKIKKTQED